MSWFLVVQGRIGQHEIIHSINEKTNNATNVRREHLQSDSCGVRTHADRSTRTWVWRLRPLGQTVLETVGASKNSTRYVDHAVKLSWRESGAWVCSMYHFRNFLQRGAQMKHAAKCLCDIECWQPLHGMLAHEYLVEWFYGKALAGDWTQDLQITSLTLCH